MKSTKGGFIKTIIVLAAIALIGGGIYYLLGPAKFCCTEPPTFAGVYEAVDNPYGQIEIESLEGGKYLVQGHIIQDNGSGAPPVGKFKGALENINGKFVYMSEYCQIDFEFMNPESLMIVDHDSCGGAGVSFSGKYIKN